MSVLLTVAVAVAALAVGVGAGLLLPARGLRATGNGPPGPVKRILLPFTGEQISRRAFEAAARLARAEGATLMPAFLARVPRNLPLDSPLPAQCEYGMPLLEAIEQRAHALGIEVDARIARGRTYRDALQRLLDHESFDRVVVSATAGKRGLSSDDLRWLLDRVPAEVMILRPAPTDTGRISAEVAGHF